LEILNQMHYDDNYGVNKYTTLDRLGKLKQQEMEETRIGLTKAGWLDNSSNGLNQNEASIEPSILQKGSRWKTSVDQERQIILAERNKNIPSKSFKNISDPNENNVQLVDRSYLQKNFKARLKSDEKLVTSTVKDFFLNSKQKKAFRIVAHHLFEPNSEQSKYCKKINEVKAKLKSVDYIFINEVSIMFCYTAHVSRCVQSFFSTGQSFKYTISSIWWYKL